MNSTTANEKCKKKKKIPVTFLQSNTSKPVKIIKIEHESTKFLSKQFSIVK